MSKDLLAQLRKNASQAMATNSEVKALSTGIVAKASSNTSPIRQSESTVQVKVDMGELESVIDSNSGLHPKLYGLPTSVSIKGFDYGKHIDRLNALASEMESETPELPTLMASVLAATRRHPELSNMLNDEQIQLIVTGAYRAAEMAEGVSKARASAKKAGKKPTAAQKKRSALEDIMGGLVLDKEIE